MSHQNPFVNKILAADTAVMSVDQALDGTGMAFFFPEAQKDPLLIFVKKIMPLLDEGYISYQKQLRERFEATFFSGGPLVITPEEKRKKPFSFGYVWITANGERTVILHGSMKLEPSNTPEWKQADIVAQMITSAAKEFKKTARAINKERKTIITVEGMALRGLKTSLSILPCLGALYGAVWRRLMEDGFNEAREIPISSWKSLLVKTQSPGLASKNEIQSALYAIGFERFPSDDESDACAMSLMAAIYPEILKESFGRIRPTMEKQREQRQASKEKKLRKEEREKDRLEKMKKKTLSKEFSSALGG